MSLVCKNKQNKQKLKINLEKNNLNAYSGVLKDLTETTEIFSLFFHLSIQFNNFQENDRVVQPSPQLNFKTFSPL